MVTSSPSILEPTPLDCGLSGFGFCRLLEMPSGSTVVGQPLTCLVTWCFDHGTCRDRERKREREREREKEREEKKSALPQNSPRAVRVCAV